MRKKMLMPAISVAAMFAARPAGLLGTVRNEAPGNVEKLLAEVQTELKRVGDDVKRTAEDALKQAKDGATLSREVKEAADRGLVQLNQLTEAATKLEAKANALDQRTKEVEQKLAERVRHPDDVGAQSLGAVVANHADVKAFAAKGAKGSVSIAVNQTITSLTTSAGGLIVADRDPNIVALPKRRMTVRQLLMPGRTSSNLVQYAKQTTRTNAAAVVSDTVTKPQSNYVWDVADAPVRTIAHWVLIARQTMDDIPQLQSEVDGELRYGLDLAEEAELLSGSGSGQHISGLTQNAAAYSAPFTPSGEQMIDTLRLAMLQIALAEYVADGMVLHPTDWARIELTKDGENRYLWANPRSLGVQTLWGLPVVDTQSMTVDKFLVGQFKMAAQIYDRMDAEVLISSEDSDNFRKNLLTLRAEKRLAMAVKRPNAMAYGDFGNV